ncbi:extracellular solute-binding protein [Streptomyces caatingaensis]|uniref:ABC transporter substrate-binding protein n=1 Tax=Streptomyces caatingaensis TaxID=1678637 RepID=A0A0K9XI05_9ACTN|nr:extracellular solute-binding protein [Streptomyces caatingaensis]KNB52292.1 ABC transporter substrate-binding protein [Streptomyces caatingaensis]
MGRPVWWVRSLVWCAAALLLGAAACTGGGGPDRRATGRPVTGTQLVIATGLDVTGKYGIRKRLVDAWNALQEKRGSPWRARAVLLPGSADLQRSQLLAALQSGGAAYDIVNLDVTWVPEFAAAGLVRELPAEFADDEDVLPKAAATARWRGKVYAAPYNSDAGLLYYRRDYLTRGAGVDEDKIRGARTWDGLSELMDTADAWARAEKSDRKGDYHNAWTSQLGPYEGLTVNAAEAFASAGVRLTDDDGAYRATTGELEKGVAEFRRRTESAHTLDSAFESDEAGSLKDFAEGRTAFLRHWPYAYRTLHAALGEDRLGVVPLPGTAALGGQDLAVSANPAMPAERVAKARELVGFLTDRTSERCLLDAGFAATRRSAYTDPAVACGDGRQDPAATRPAEGAARDMPRDADGRPRYARSTLLPALESAVQRPRTPLYGAFTHTFTTQLALLHTSAEARSATDEEIARRLDAALRAVLPSG